MSLHEEVDALRRVPLFAKIEPSKLKLLAFTSEKLEYQRGQDLCKQGDAGDAMFIIMAGEADVIVNTPNGEHTVARLGKNSFVGEIAILCDVPRTATVRASSTATVLRISKELFFRLVGEFPQIAVEIMRELAHRLDDTTKALAKAKAA
ncbi:MAG: cyclic nucleotide-binding domain-containing protein [Alphaproteobacteria bacterium]|nr:cyclic nucleotide-binding domain-containing protein [Alphaproteobacteria bacterium]